MTNSQWPVQILSSWATNHTLSPHWNKFKLPPPAAREPSCLPKHQRWCFRIVCKSILSKMFAITSCHTCIWAKLFEPIYGILQFFSSQHISPYQTYQYQTLRFLFTKHKTQLNPNNNDMIYLMYMPITDC